MFYKDDYFGVCFGCGDVFIKPTDGDRDIDCDCGFSIDRSSYEHLLYESKCVFRFGVMYRRMYIEQFGDAKSGKNDPGYACLPDYSVFLTFVALAAASGVTYDVLKYILAKLLFASVKFAELDDDDASMEFDENDMAHFFHFCTEENDLKNLQVEATEFYEGMPSVVGNVRQAIAQECNPDMGLSFSGKETLKYIWEPVKLEFEASSISLNDVFVLPQSDKYHQAGCSFIKEKGAAKFSKRAAELAGFSACKRCGH